MYLNVSSACVATLQLNFDDDARMDGNQILAKTIITDKDGEKKFS